MNDSRQENIKGYTWRERIGAGKIGVVYRAFQPAMGRDVAIKVIPPEYANQPDFIRQFDTQAQRIARLEHPHIVPLYDYWRDPHGAFLIMRWFPESLRTSLHKGSWSVDAVVRLLDQLAGALSLAHRQGIIHQDIKLENILLDEDNNAYLADFGVAQITHLTPQTEADLPIEIASTLSPEQLRSGEITPRTDIFSLGLVLYQVLTAQPPFPNAVNITDLLHTPLPRLTTVRRSLPSGLDAVLRIATAKDPAQRYPSVMDFAAAFRAALPPAHLTTTPQPLADPLTERELDILRLMPDGLSNPEIAGRLFLSSSTVKWYVKEIYRKLEVHSRSQAIERAHHLHLLDSHIEATTEPESPAPNIELPAVSTSPPLPEPVNPYKGLRAFQEADAPFFFGRTTLIQQLVDRLSSGNDNARLLTVVGPSGSGKSSVVKAGLLPALRQGALHGSARWFITEMLPGAHPLEELEDALLRVSVNPLPGILDQLFQDQRGLTRAISRTLPGNADIELVLVIDQFEELFTLVSDEHVRTHFIDLLLAAVTDTRSRIRVILTLRADFYDCPLLYTRLAEWVRNHTEAIIPLSASELEQAIVGPAERAGLTFEAGLVATMLKEVGEQPGMLPLLEYALSELYERRQGLLLTRAAYEELGGISGALARRADTLFESLDAAGQNAARQIFLRLITLGEGVEDTRRRVQQEELASLGADTFMEDVIQVFTQYRLLTLDRDPLTRGPTVEIAHEALIREWGRLREWLRESREALHVQRRLLTASQDWLQSGRDEGFLAAGARLIQFEGLSTDEEIALTGEERGYVMASVTAREQQEQLERERRARELRVARQSANRLRSLVGFLALFLVVVAALSVFALNNAALAQANFTHSEAQRLASESNNLQLGKGNSELAALLALRSMNLQYTPQGDEALTGASFLNLPVSAFGGEHFSSSSLEFSPDGKTIVTSNNDTTAALYDVATGQEIRSFSGHSRPVTTAHFSPDGTMIVTASLDHGLRLWDIATGSRIRTFVGHMDAVRAVAFSPDGRSIASGSDDHTVRLWDVATGQQLRQFDGHTDIVKEVVFSPDGDLLITGGFDRTVRLWDVATGQQLRQIDVGALVNSLAVSRDGMMLVTGSDDFIIRLWETRSGQLIRPLTGHTGWVNSTVFSPDDQTILTSSDDTTARLWDVQTGQEFRRFAGSTVFLTSAVFAPDSRSVATTNFGVIKLWRLERNPGTLQLDANSGYLNNVQFSADGTSLLTAEQSGTAHLWDVQTDQVVRAFSSPGQPMYGVSSSPDGSLILTSQNSVTSTTITLWDALTGQVLHEFDSAGGPGGNQNVAFSPDGRYVLFGDGIGLVHLFDARSWREVRRFTGNLGWSEATVAGVTFAPDGRTILTGAADFAARLWNLSEGQQIHQLDILVFVPGTGNTVHSDDTGAYSTAYSPDGELLAAGTWGGSIYLWDFTTGRLIQRLVGHRNAVRVSFSADGRYLMSSGADGTIRLWDINTWQEVRRIATTSFSLGAISPDSQFILAVNDLNSAELVPVDYHAILRDLCSRLTRDLSDDERHAYDITDDSSTCPPAQSSPNPTTSTWAPPALPVWTPIATQQLSNATRTT